MTLHVVVAEDNYLVREGVGKLINSEDDLEVVASCIDYDSLLETVAAEKPDVVVTDIRMPPTGTDEGIRAANELRIDHPELGVVVLSPVLRAEPTPSGSWRTVRGAGPTC